MPYEGSEAAIYLLSLDNKVVYATMSKSLEDPWNSNSCLLIQSITQQLGFY